MFIFVGIQICALVKQWTSANARLQLWITTGEPYKIGDYTSIPDYGW